MVEISNLGALEGDEWGFTGVHTTHALLRKQCAPDMHGLLGE